MPPALLTLAALLAFVAPPRERTANRSDAPVAKRPLPQNPQSIRALGAEAPCQQKKKTFAKKLGGFAKGNCSVRQTNDRAVQVVASTDTDQPDRLVLDAIVKWDGQSFVLPRIGWEMHVKGHSSEHPTQVTARTERLGPGGERVQVIEVDERRVFERNGQRRLERSVSAYLCFSAASGLQCSDRIELAVRRERFQNGRFALVSEEQSALSLPGDGTIVVSPQKGQATQSATKIVYGPVVVVKPKG